MPEPTTQQRHAIDLRQTSIVLSSGAGCGKTFVLTNRFLSHLNEDDVSVGEIIAITFTDRAARQMRDKIREAVASEVAVRPGDRRWLKHLDDLETASIQTIHSFCGDLLRQHAVQAGLDPRFEVLDEILAENLRAEALRDTLQSLLTADTPAGQDLCELVVLFGWPATIGAVRDLLKERDATAWTNWLMRSPGDIAKEWAGVERDSLLRDWVEYLLAASPKIAHLLHLFRVTECVGPEMRENVRKVLVELPELAKAKDIGAAVEELCEAAKVGKERVKAWPSEEVYESIKSAMEDFRGELPAKMQVFIDAPEGVEAAAIVGQRFLRVALTVAEDYRQKKHRAAVLDFEDLLVFARNLLVEHSEVRDSLRRRYRYLLLDEMQDTDPIQMELIRQLCDRDKEPDKLFAVGDTKQSIYRFRGADVELFDRLKRAVGAKGQLSLTTNYRSQPAILHFVNALCSLRIADYEPIEPHKSQFYNDPCVEFLWSVPAEDSIEKETAAEIRSREADAIAGRIVQLIQSSEVRLLADDGPRSIRHGDIVLLFRSMSNVAIYESALRRHGLDYYLVGGRAFFAQQEIYDLLNLLRTLENPDDSIAVAGTLRSPFACLSDDSLLLLGLHDGGLWDGLHDNGCVAKLDDDQRPRAERIRALFAKWRPLKDRLPIARIIGRVIDDTAYDAALQFETLGERKLANLWKLIDLAREFDRSGRFGLADFIARLGEMVTNQPREEQAATQPENADVIKIMSIHQAKGLEFPVVFVPDFSATSRGGATAVARWDRRLGCLVRPPDEDPPLFTDFPYRLGLTREAMAEWREDLRILYVACTRTKDLLILSAGLKDRLPHGPTDQPIAMKGANAWLLALGERFNIATGECLDSSIQSEKRPSVRVNVIGPLPSTQLRASKKAPEVFTEIEAKDISPIPSAPWPEVIDVSELECNQCDEERIAPIRRAIAKWDLKSKAPESIAPFAQSEWPARMSRASRLFRNLDYITVWPALERDHRPMIRGTIDFLWQESDGWHVLSSGASASDLQPHVEAWVVEQQFAEKPRSHFLFNVTNGQSTSIDHLLSPADLRRELDRALLVNFAPESLPTSAVDHSEPED